MELAKSSENRRFRLMALASAMILIVAMMVAWPLPSAASGCSFGTAYDSDSAVTLDSNNDCARIGVNAKVSIHPSNPTWWGWEYSYGTEAWTHPPYTVVGVKGCGDC